MRFNTRIETIPSNNIVEEMQIASGLPAIPKIHIIDSALPNAFAVGLNPKRASVAVTSGLLARLNRDELQGVIAHEIGHIANRDTLFMTLAGVTVGSVIILADLFVRGVSTWPTPRRRSTRGFPRGSLRRSRRSRAAAARRAVATGRAGRAGGAGRPNSR